jgi:hypothetical protein
MNMIHSLLLVTSLWAPRALAGDDVAEAEHNRVADEMERLAERKIWAGVERKFTELEGLDASMTLDDLLIGAHAARELGNVASASMRLKDAAQIKATKEVVDWLWDIDNNYGHVDLVAVPARSAELLVVTMPFDPNQRRAVDAAVKRSKQDGAFRGLLPSGGYSFAGQKFEVVPGISVKIEVSPRMRRQGLIDPVIIVRDSPGAVLEAAPPQKDD